MKYWEIVADTLSAAWLVIGLLLHGDARYGWRCLVYANRRKWYRT
jgi:hypothetical protein